MSIGLAAEAMSLQVLIQLERHDFHETANIIDDRYCEKHEGTSYLEDNEIKVF